MSEEKARYWILLQNAQFMPESRIIEAMSEGFGSIGKLAADNDLECYEIARRNKRHKRAYVRVNIELIPTTEDSKTIFEYRGKKMFIQPLSLEEFDVEREKLSVKRVKSPVVDGEAGSQSRRKGISISAGRKRKRTIDKIPTLEDFVTPLAKIEYEEQLSIKLKEIKNGYRRLRKGLKSFSSPNLNDIVIVPSPVLEGYRNKTEYSIGYCEEKPVVGFKFGSFDGGVEAATNIKTVSPLQKEIASFFQDFISRNSEIVGNTMEGELNEDSFWKMLVIRETTLQEVMVVAAVGSKDKIQSDVLNTLKELLVKGLTSSFGDRMSIFLRFLDNDSIEHLHGNTHIHESVYGKKFLISPSSFFQVNTKMMELMYSYVKDLVDVDEDTTLLDIYCGTGSIGISVCEGAKLLVGVEIIEAAIEDARINAKENGVLNAEFVCGPSQEVIQNIVDKYAKKGSNAVAIIDPPRAGILGKTAVILRKTSSVHRLVYCSCNPKTFFLDVWNLCKPETKAYKGSPFKIRDIRGFDMFPHTEHFEIVCRLER